MCDAETFKYIMVIHGAHWTVFFCWTYVTLLCIHLFHRIIVFHPNFLLNGLSFSLVYSQVSYLVVKCQIYILEVCPVDGKITGDCDINDDSGSDIGHGDILVAVLRFGDKSET